VIFVQSGQNDLMARRDQSLLAEIERGALNDSVSLAATLRRCIALGAQTRSAELRDWASNELSGFRNDKDIPKYRIIHVPLKIDAVAITAQIRGQQISPTDLPDVVQGHISEELRLAYGVGDIQALIRNAERSGQRTVKLSSDGAADVVKMMNLEMQNAGQSIMALYWDVSISRLGGMLDQIRTTLVRLVSEMRATMSDDELMPSSEETAQAVNVVLHGGKRQSVTINAAKADNSGIARIESVPEQKESRWTKISTIWVIIGVIVALIALYIAYRQWRG